VERETQLSKSVRPSSAPGEGVGGQGRMQDNLALQTLDNDQLWADTQVCLYRDR
jgi:hypothetical protein